MITIDQPKKLSLDGGICGFPQDLRKISHRLLRKGYNTAPFQSVCIPCH